MYGFLVRCYTSGTARLLIFFLKMRGIEDESYVEEAIGNTVKFPILVGCNSISNCMCYSDDGNWMNTRECKEHWRCYEYANNIYDILLEKEGDLLNG